jgi:integrase
VRYPAVTRSEHKPKDRTVPSKKLTAAFVESVKPPEIGRIEYFDAALPGFGLRVTENGAKSWVMFYRIHGRLRRHTIGSYPKLTLGAARDAAEAGFRAVAKGEDPAEAKKRSEAGAGTVKAVGELFITRYAKTHQRRSWPDTQRILQTNVYPHIGHMQFADAERSHVLDVLDKAGDRRTVKRPGMKAKVLRGGPMASRNTHKVLRKLFRWAHEDRGIIKANPISGMRSPARDRKRKRFLTDDEIRALWRVWSQPSPYGAACKLMLLIAQRVHEASKIARSEIDADGNWLIKAQRYKTDLDQLVPLSGAARSLLAEQKAIKGSDLFFTLSGEELNGWSNAKEWMDRASGVTNWQFRDVRRTAKTLMSRFGVRPDISERVLGHVIPGTAGVYDMYEYLEEKRAALETLAGAIDRILNPQPNVVQLRSAPSG